MGLAISLASISIAEAVIQLLGWNRPWALVGVVAVGHFIAARLTRRRRASPAHTGETSSLPRPSQQGKAHPGVRRRSLRSGSGHYPVTTGAGLLHVAGTVSTLLRASSRPFRDQRAITAVYDDRWCR